MKKIQLRSDDGVVHQCNCRREGNWAIFTCSVCMDYEKRVNVVTGDIKTYAPHNKLSDAASMPLGFPPYLYNPN